MLTNFNENCLLLFQNANKFLPLLPKLFPWSSDTLIKTYYPLQLLTSLISYSNSHFSIQNIENLQITQLPVLITGFPFGPKIYTSLRGPLGTLTLKFGKHPLKITLHGAQFRSVWWYFHKVKHFICFKQTFWQASFSIQIIVLTTKLLNIYSIEMDSRVYFAIFMYLRSGGYLRNCLGRIKTIFVVEAGNFTQKKVIYAWSIPNYRYYIDQMRGHPRYNDPIVTWPETN